MAKADFKVDYQVLEGGKKSPGWSLEGDIKGEMTLGDLLDFTKKNLILIADYALREEQEQGFDKNPIVSVDGKVGKPVIAVNPLGNITFTSRANIADVVNFIYDSIQERSPVDTGRYKSSNFVLLNKTEVARGKASLKQWLATNPDLKTGDALYFINVQPYARKLERQGITRQKRSTRLRKSKDEKARSGVAGKVLAPNGAYYLTSRAAIRLFKQNLKIAFKYIPGSYLGLAGNFAVSRGTPGRKPSKKKKSPSSYLYPAIVVSINESGLK